MPTFLSTTGREIHYRERGRGPAAFFVHAVTLDSTLWLDQLEELSDIRRCIAPDLAGHGLSDPDPARIQPTSRHFQQMLELFDARTTGPVDLVGFSAGGVIAALICQARPQRARSLTLISTGFPKAASPHDPTHTEIAMLLMNEDKGAYYRRLAGYLMAPDASLFVRARYRSMITQTRFETIVSFMADTPTEPVPGLAASLKLPIYMPAGELDAASRSREPELAGANVIREVVPGAARLVSIERPQVLNAGLRRFWAGVA